MLPLSFGWRGIALAALLASSPALVHRQTALPAQTDDEYTRYDLLAPETHSFRITYDVTATSAGALLYWNGIRRGSEASAIAVTDRMTGAPLEWSLVDGKTARENGSAEASAEGRYIQIRLARPVPAGGEARLRIFKTYRDAASYRSTLGTAGSLERPAEIIFERTLSIPFNSVVLPAGYELIACNYPSQVRTESDGRIRVSFLNPGPAEVPYRVVGRNLPALSGEALPDAARSLIPGQRGAAPGPPASSAAQRTAAATEPPGARLNFTFSERALEDREIVYFLEPPETHSFRLYHDYTETREGVDRYLNVVRAGSKASNPSAKILDTGEPLKVETLQGAEALRRGIRAEAGDPIAPDAEVVVIWFPAVKKGQSVRLRIEETYTDPGRYLLAGDELIWDRSFGRPRNTVVLPAGWYVTSSSIPATASLWPGGRTALHFVNDRPDNIAVFLRARRTGREQAPALHAQP